MSEPASTPSLEAVRLGTGRAAVPRLRRVARWAAAILGLVVVYYGVGSFLYHRVDDDPDFAPPAPIEGGSRGPCQEFRVRAGMMGAKEPRHAETQRASYS